MKGKIICKTIEGGEKEINIKKLSFRPSVYGVLIENNKVLLSGQWDGYDFPGGGIEINETVSEALEREFFEETGTKIKKDKIIACESSFSILPFSQKPINSILIYFLCNKLGGKLSLKNISKDESQYINMPEWVSLDKIDKLKFYNSIDSVKLIRKACKLSGA